MQKYGTSLCILAFYWGGLCTKMKIKKYVGHGLKNEWISENTDFIEYEVNGQETTQLSPLNPCPTHQVTKVNTQPLIVP